MPDQRPHHEQSIDELRSQVEELRTSRARLVAAADADRRLIERQLHDGPQQHLVALVVSLQLAQQLADEDIDGLKALLDELRRDVREGLEALRELAQRIYPPLLLDRGLSDALRAAAAGADIETRVEANGLARYPPDLEATVYFCCVEALRNAAAHAGPGARAVVRVWSEPATFRFEVVDDGAGFAEHETGRRRGLDDMADRLGAKGGTLTISSQVGGGTRISGSIPSSP